MPGRKAGYERRTRLPVAERSRAWLHPVQLAPMTNFTSAIKQLEQERNRLSSRLEQINKAVSALTEARSTGMGKRSPLPVVHGLLRRNVLGGPMLKAGRSFRLFPENAERCLPPQLLEFALRRKLVG